jgi:ERCC4-related helicase
MVTEGRPILCSCIGRKDHVNPKLEELKEIIFRLYKDKPESRVIVLIKTRDLVQAIENWMKETDGSTHQKQELPMAAMFDNGSGRNDQSL